MSRAAGRVGRGKRAALFVPAIRSAAGARERDSRLAAQGPHTLDLSSIKRANRPWLLVSISHAAVHSAAILLCGC